MSYEREALKRTVIRLNILRASHMELIEVLRDLNSVMDHYWNSGRTDAQVNSINVIQKKCLKVLNNADEL